MMRRRDPCKVWRESTLVVRAVGTKARKWEWKAPGSERRSVWSGRRE